jgi:DNA polymerase I-like protein with 3'-5' exonuclease and polymerase domains
MKRIAIDIETNMAHSVISLAVTQDIDTGETRKWKAQTGLWEYLKDATLIVAHNLIGFDAVHLNRLWKTKIGLKQAYDTLIVSRLLEPSREGGHSLDAWGKTLGVKKLNYKATWQWMMDRTEAYDGECFDAPIDALLEHYCVRDVGVLCKLFIHLEAAIKDQGFSKESVILEHAVASIIAKQERNGFKLDIPYATMLLTTVKGKLDSIYEQMQDRWPPYSVERISEKTGKRLKDSEVVFNPGSRQQIGEKLIELGWKPKTFTPTGQPIVDEGSLADAHFPEALLIAEYLMLQKRVAQITSWIEAVGDDGRVHGKVITNGAVTGRMTHSSPNMAQIPNSSSVFGPECRECWTVEEGSVLVGCDASGLELRMLAHYMKDKDYVETVVNGSSKNGTDVHTKNQKAAGLQTRDQAKTFIYGFLYGAGPAKIGQIVGGNAKDGKRLIDSFLVATPALARLREHVSKVASKGYVPGLDGRKIWVRSEHAALNSLLQGAGAIVMKQALVLFDEKIRKHKWPVKMVVNVHDEFQWETEEKYAIITGTAAKQSIVEAGEFYKLRCPLDGEFKYGKSWRSTH